MSVFEKCAIVTGASRGIGRATSLTLAKDGHNVVVNYVNNAEKALSLVDEIQKLGAGAVAICADASVFKDAESIINTAVLNFGRIDVLVNNAGITRDTLIARMKEEDFDSVINVNLKGCFNCIKHASVYMMKQRSGCIINISSVVGVSGNAGQANYAASKAGIIGLTKSVAKELGSRNINCNAIAPGYIETDMTRLLPENLKSGILDSVQLKRLGNVEDVANLVSFLASDKAKYITGQVICVDGGMAM